MLSHSEIKRDSNENPEDNENIKERYGCLQMPISELNNNNNDIITMNSTASPSPIYPIDRSYTSEQYSPEIPPEDVVVRPLNQYCYAIQSSSKVKACSRFKGYEVRPAYSNCTNCYKSGPLSKYCNECNTDQIAG